ncbi:MAG: hypothetical protein AAB791_03685, partial [Patescibacteria group bacterium]
ECDSKVGRSKLPNWLLEWVDSGYGWPSRNDCEFRKRALLWAFSIKPAWIIIQLLLAVLVVSGTIAVLAIYLPLACLAGRRKIAWRSMLHPQKTVIDAMNETIVLSDKSVFTTKQDGSPRSPVSLLLCPALWLLILVVSLIGQYALRLSEILVGFTPLFLTFALCISAATLIITPLARWLGGYGDWSDDYKTRKQLVKETRELRELLGLTISPEFVSVDLVPREQRTLGLWFLSRKTNICRPFARE